MRLDLFAYLDLASGSMIIQAAIAGVVAVPILLRHQIRRMFGRVGPSDEVAGEQGGSATASATADTELEARADGTRATRP